MNNQFIIAFGVGFVIGIIGCVLGIIYLHKKMKQEVPAPVAALRSAFPNSNKVWTAEEKEAAILAYGYGMGIFTMSSEFGRTPKEIASMLYHQRKLNRSEEAKAYVHPANGKIIVTDEAIEKYTRERIA